MMQECFHCYETPGRCRCILCGADKMVEGIATRLPGTCVACKGRAYHRHYMALLQRYDPSVRANYVRHPAADGNKGWLEYIPFKGLHESV